MKRFQLYALIAAISVFANTASAQDEDLLSMVGGDEKPQKERVKYAFKSPRVINSHSIEFLNPGTLDFRILHRFGQLDQGYKNFFGLDQASMRMSFDFGIMHNLMAGVGRSTFKKELDAFVKYAPIRQSTGGKLSSPVTLALVSGITMDGMPWADPSRTNYFTSRLAYYFQAIIGRKFSEGFSLQVSPTMVHRNLVQLEGDPNNIYALGVGGRLKLSKRIALTWDYNHVLVGMPDSGYYNPLSVGVDIETGGHVFQLHFSNATGMNERAFITETTGNWGKGEVRFGFNLSRVFQLKKKKKD
ncbi:MAG: hypothetical protein IPM85_02105 [Chitinophagaceae bacterium]|nr:hypothetical protein [Chitinophagaceae bacterium]